MKIIQLLVTLQKGDAIGNFTLNLHQMLIQEGYDALIYAYNIGKNVDSGVAKKINTLKKVEQDDLIIYQMCEGHKINEFIRKLPCKKIAIYHNITPPQFFSEYGRELQQVQEKGLKVISSMNNVFTRCIADSEFNKQDLISMGYSYNNIEVIPLTVEFDDYKREPDTAIIEKYNDDFVNFLFVGRIVPNKKQEDIIRIFAYYHKFINEKSRLFLIGSPFIKDYDAALKEYIKYLGLADSIIIPGISAFPEVIGYYSCADIFLCMSEHEGFCVPLIEAMFFDVPIVSYESTAIPYTLREAGVMVNTKDPEKVSNVIEKVINDDVYLDIIITRQRQRLKFFDAEKSRQKYLTIIKDVLGEGR